NWSVFERIHTKNRNKLEHKRLSDLVFINYNLKLKDHYKTVKTSGDPIDYEWISNTNFWVMEDLTPKLNYDDLMRAIHTNDDAVDTNEGQSASKKRHRDGGICNFAFNKIFSRYNCFLCKISLLDDAGASDANSIIGANDGGVEDDFFSMGEDNIFY
ncbi:hypothetical protein LINPERPRIM_LOCUS7023, partial [Linum perenne]